MSNAVIGALRAEMSLSTAALEGGAAKAQRIFSMLGSTMRDTSGKAQTFGRGFDTGISKGLKGAEASAAIFAEELDRLKLKFDPLYGASKRYESALGELQRAQKMGAISSRQYEAHLESLNAEFGRMGDGLVQVGRAGIQGGTGLQNVAFQVQDFAVQVGAGTSAAQALGQQLPQLLSGFGVFGALLGTAAAVAIPMLAMALGSAGTSAKTAEQAVNDLTDAVSAATEANAAAIAPADELAEKYGAMAGKAREALAAIAEGETLAAMAELNATAQSLALTFDGVSLSVLNYQDILGQGTVASQRIADAFGITRQSAEGLVGLFLELETADGPIAIAEAASVLRDRLLEAGVAANNDLVMGLNRASEQALILSNSAPGAGWMNAAVGETNLLIGKLMQATAQKAALDGAVARLKTSGLASQYAQYGAGRTAFDQAAREALPLYGARASSQDSGGGRGASRQVDGLAKVAAAAAEAKTEFGGLFAALESGLKANGDGFAKFADTMAGNFQNAIAKMITEQAKLRLSGQGAAAGQALSGGGLMSALGGPVGIALGIGGMLFGAARQRREAAAQRRAQAAQERGGLELELLRLQNDTPAIRAKELEALKPANRALQERIYKLQDEARVTEERKGLEEQLLELQGNQAELDRRWLDTLLPANRALGEQVLAARSAKAAVDDLNAALGKLAEEDFASALDFARARGAMASGLRVVAGTDYVGAAAAVPAATSAAVSGDAAMSSMAANLALLLAQFRRVIDVDDRLKVVTA